MPISIDTRRAEVARAALEAGRRSSTTSPRSTRPRDGAAGGETKCAVVLMHMRGGPADHIKFAHYRDVVARSSSISTRARDLRSRMESRARESFSIRESDSPKTRSIIWRLLAALPDLCALGYPVLVGASRKTFVARDRRRARRGRARCCNSGRGRERAGDCGGRLDRARA